MSVYQPAIDALERKIARHQECIDGLRYCVDLLRNNTPLPGTPRTTPEKTTGTTDEQK